MVFSPKLSPVLKPTNPFQYSQEKNSGGYFLSDPSLEVLKFTNGVVDFLEGAQDYWSSKGLMGGYGEAANLLTTHLKDSVADSNPVIQATAGGFFGAGKILGAIPFGLGHWLHQSARDSVDHGLGAGFKTFISIPVEGFVAGGKFLLNQGANWIGGNIAESTFGVADEVSTTLGTAALMFLGIKAIHTGGTGIINGLKNIEISSPALATTTGLAIPVIRSAEAITGGGPLTQGLIYMSGTKEASEGPKSSQGKGPIDFKQITKDAAHDRDAVTALSYFAKKGEPEAMAGLVELIIKAGSDKARVKLFGLAKEGSQMALDAMIQISLQHPNSGVILDLYHWVRRESKPQVLAEFRKLDLDAVLSQGKYRERRIEILTLKTLAGDIDAVQALANLAKEGDRYALAAFKDLFRDIFIVGDIPTRIKAVEIFTQTDGIPKCTDVVEEMVTFQYLPVELGTPILNWIIRESVKNPKIAQSLTEKNPSWPHGWPSKGPTIYASADYSPIYQLAKHDQRYGYLLRKAYLIMEKSPLGPAKRAELKPILEDLGLLIN